MLICFGAAWPFSIHKSYTSRVTGGKSVIFLYVIFLGYIAGTMHKLFYNYDLIIIQYILNGTMVFIDILLFHRNKRLERLGLSGAKS